MNDCECSLQITRIVFIFIGQNWWWYLTNCKYLKKKNYFFFGITDPGSEAYRDSMSSVVILSCQPNSHPFQERHISLLEPVKIGRSVARARPQSSNGIFDCKVLSRNHAVVWYENGKVSYMFMYYLLMHLCFCSHKSKICTIAWLDKESSTVIGTISGLCCWKVSSL